MSSKLKAETTAFERTIRTEESPSISLQGVNPNSAVAREIISAGGVDNAAITLSSLISALGRINYAMRIGIDAVQEFPSTNQISIDGSGAIKFRYVGPLAAVLDNVYSNTNEQYSDEFKNKIGKIRGMDRYLGVLGGIVQHPLLIGLLQPHNQLTEVRLVDTNPTQLLGAALSFSAYNGLQINRRTCVEDTQEGHWWREFDTNSFRLDGVTVELEAKDIRRALQDAESGVHFIYLSNVVGLSTPDQVLVGAGWLNREESNAVLMDIQENPKIKVGSIVVVSQTFGYAHVALQKGKNGFKIYALGTPELESKRREIEDFLGSLATHKNDGGTLKIVGIRRET